MSSTTKLALLRHGQTDWNIEYRLQGVTDIPLNETGLAQAAAAANRLKHEHWDVLLASPLSRAADTARIVADAARFEGELQIEELLLERSFGAGEGMLYAEWKAGGAEEHLGAETRADFAARVLRFLEHISENFAGKTVLAVGHGAFIREALAICSNGALPPAGERISNACLNRFEHDPQSGWRVSAYSPETFA